MFLGGHFGALIFREFRRFVPHVIYSGYDIIRYLEFYFGEFADKNEFLRFLSYEVSERLKLPIPAGYRRRLQSTQAWLTEKQDSREIVNGTAAAQNINPPLDFKGAVRNLSDKIATRIDEVMSSTEEKFGRLTDSFVTGNIELNNHNHLERLVQLHILIQSIKSPDGASEDRLYKRNSSTDLASILHLHFRAFKGKKFNTVQVKIMECSDRLKINDPKVQKVVRALTDFFY